MILTSTQAFEYASADKLDAHLEGKFHTGISKFERLVKIAASEHPDASIECPYCTGADMAAHAEVLGVEEGDISFAPTSSFRALTNLKTHIEDSNAATHGKEHDELKALGGWYEPDFYPPKKSARTQVKQAAQAKKNLKNLGIELAKARPVNPGEPHPTFPGVAYGHQPGIPPRFANSIIATASPSALPVPPRFAHLISAGTPSQGIPSGFEGLAVPAKSVQEQTAMPAGLTHATPAVAQTPATPHVVQGPSSHSTRQGTSRDEPEFISSAEEESDLDEEDDDNDAMDVDG